MDDFRFEVKGLAEMNAALLELGTNGARRAGRKALRQGANVVLRATRNTAPVLTGYLSKKGFYTHDRGVLGDQVLFSVDLKKNAFYGRFIEYGTSKMQAQPFMRPAAADSARDSVAVTGEVLGLAIIAEAEKLRR